MKEQDYTVTGLKIEGQYENDRNQDNHDLYKDIIREAYGVQDVIIGHHLVYQTEYKNTDGFVYQLVEEIPSADSLIFDHEVAQKIWGKKYRVILSKLAMEPVETRDALLKKLFYSRVKEVSA